MWDGGQQHEASDGEENPRTVVEENTYDLSPVRATKDHSEPSELPSPHLADFDSFLSTMADKQRKSSRRGKGVSTVLPDHSEEGGTSTSTACNQRQRATNDNEQADDNSTMTARHQRRRRLSEGKRNNFTSSVILESQPPEAVRGDRYIFVIYSRKLSSTFLLLLKLMLVRCMRATITVTKYNKKSQKGKKRTQR